MPEPPAAETPMLWISGLPFAWVNNIVGIANRNFPKEAYLSLALINGPRACVVGGVPRLLQELRDELGRRRVAPGESQTHVPYKNRKLEYKSRFLAMTSIFHSPMLSGVPDLVARDCGGEGVLDALALSLPVFSTSTGADLCGSRSLVREIVALIAVQQVDWLRAVQQSFACDYILDFGPGATSSAGLTAALVDGAGPRVVLATYACTNYEPRATEPQSMCGLEALMTLARDHALFTPADNWQRDFSPSVVTVKGRTVISTRYSRLLGCPPIMVAGMTPTTSLNGLELVAAAANAGFLIEVACGGLPRPEIFTAHLRTLHDRLRPGAGIALNML